MTEFRFHSWGLKLSAALASLIALDALVTDDETIKDHLRRIAQSLSWDLQRLFSVSNIGGAHKTRRRQMVVVAVSLCEAVVSEFLSLWFAAKPLRMGKFVGG